MKTIEELAKEHADWEAELVRKIAYDNFIHGAKHQAEIDKTNEMKKSE